MEKSSDAYHRCVADGNEKTEGQEEMTQNLKRLGADEKMNSTENRENSKNFQAGIGNTERALMELDRLLEICDEQICDLADLENEFSPAFEVFHIITEKTGLTSNDKNSADVSNITKELEKEKKSYQSLEREVKEQLQAFEWKDKASRSKLENSALERENKIKELETGQFSQIQNRKNLEKILRTVGQIGIEINKDGNLLRVNTKSGGLSFELLDSSRCKILKSDPNFVYKQSQTLYASELSYGLSRFLISTLGQSNSH